MSLLFLFLGVIAIVFNSIWLGLLLGSINVFLRDLHMFISNLLRLAFFMTPVLWYPSSIENVKSLFISLNPFYYFLEIIRMPLLGIAPSFKIWSTVLCISVIGWVISIFTFAQLKRKIAYWV